MAYREVRGPLAYIRALLVPTCLNRQEWRDIFANRKLSLEFQQRQVDYALKVLYRCRTDPLVYKDAIRNLRETLA